MVQPELHFSSKCIYLSSIPRRIYIYVPDPDNKDTFLARLTWSDLLSNTKLPDTVEHDVSE
jgi:hypothetical protein